MTTEYFFDSYAIIEILNGSSNYSKFINSEFITTKLNLFEVYLKLLRLSEEKANIFIKRYMTKTVDFDEFIIKEACRLKISNKNLSMTDCIGYVISIKAGVKFLTGDKEFEIIKNVEFVK